MGFYNPYTGEYVVTPADYGQLATDPSISGANYQQQPNGAQQVAGATGQIGGVATGGYLANSLSGGGAAASSAPIQSAAAASSPLTSALGGGGVAEGGGSLAGAGSAGEVAPVASGSLLPAAGVLAGAYTGYQQGTGLRDAAKGKDLSLMQAGALALPTFGASLLFTTQGKRLFGDRNKWQTEANRLRSLADSGVNVPDAMFANMPSGGRKKSELINHDFAGDYIGANKDGTGWVNNKFAESRNESDLRPEDIWGYSSFMEKFGNDWLGKFSEGQRRDIAQAALDSGAVNEHHGTIDVNWDPNLQNKVDVITGAKKLKAL